MNVCLLAGDDCCRLAEQNPLRLLAHRRLGIDLFRQLVGAHCRGPILNRLEPPLEARKAADEFARIATKTKAYAAKQGDNFISEIVKASANATAAALTLTATGGIGISYLLYLLAERLMSAVNAIQAWLDLLGNLR